MSKTPEGDIKKIVKDRLIAKGLIPAGKAVLATTANTGWFYMPVSIGLGVHGVPDFIGHYKGRFFAIETKAPNKNPTALQMQQLNALHVTDAAVWVIRCEEDLHEIEDWMQEVSDDLDRGEI